jgi:RNA polymerase sigma-70 factor (ECF subfamily)
MPSPAFLPAQPAILAIVKLPMTDTEPPSDEHLVLLAKNGDDPAFAELVKRYSRRILRVARNITNNDEDSEDVLQETFLKAYTHLDRFEGNSKFYTWLVRIAMNEALMKLRKRKTGKVVSLDEELSTGDDTVTREIAVWDGNPEDQFSQHELRELLDKTVSSLPDGFRTVFILRDVEELSTEETADMLGLSIPAVKSRLLRARLQLREKLTRVFKKKGDDVFAFL